MYLFLHFFGPGSPFLDDYFTLFPRTFLLTLSCQQFFLKMNLIALLCNFIASALAILLKAHLFLSHVNCHTPDPMGLCAPQRQRHWRVGSLSSTLVSLGILGRPLSNWKS